MARASALLRAGTILLALVFTLPACFTARLWGNTRPLTVEPVAPPAAMRAFRLADRADTIVLELAPATAQALRAHVRELPADLQWLEVRGRGPHGTHHVEDLLLRDHDGEVRRVVAFRASSDAPVQWALAPGPPRQNWFGPVDHLDPYLDAVCDVVPVPRPARLGAELDWLALDVAINDRGLWLPIRIALTPIAVVADAATIVVGAAVVVALVPLAPFVWVWQQLAGD